MGKSETKATGEAAKYRTVLATIRDHVGEKEKGYIKKIAGTPEGRQASNDSTSAEQDGILLERVIKRFDSGLYN